MRSGFLLALLIMYSCSASAQDKGLFKAATIPASLKAGAHAIVRFSEQDVRIRSLQQVVEKEHYIITILDKQGEEYATHYAASSKLSKVDEQYGYIYDKDGDQQYKIRKSDYSTYNRSLQPGYYDDSKVTSYHCAYKEYPYTVEFFTTTIHKFTFFIPSWQARPGNDCAVETARYILSRPKNFIVHTKIYNADIEPSVSEDEDNITTQWQVSNVAAEREEPFVKEDFDGSPALIVAPEHFMLEEKEGDMKSWKSLGDFIYTLNKDRDILTDDKKQKVKELTANLADKKQKIAALYNYMQNNTRYVSIQYGIGGWQTLDAAFVCSNQYGDCKALSNYMMAMLKAADINSYAVIISAGREEYFALQKDFPVNHFNHVILCVPDGADTTWLECTSPYNPAGYLGSFTADRDALMVTPDGGVVVHTPCYKADKNKIVHIAKAVYTETGSLNYDLSSHYTGLGAEPLLRVSSYSETEKDHYIHNKFRIPSYTATQYSLKRNDGINVLGYDEQMHIEASNMVQKAGVLKILNTNLIPFSLPFEVAVSERKKPFTIFHDLALNDTFTINLPDNAEVTSIPAAVTIKSEFGQFQIQVRKEAASLIVSRELSVHSGTYSPDSYTKYEEWVSSVTNNKYYKVVLKEK